MRGEHGIIFALSGEALGSSPHARGAPMTETTATAKHGIIPACAGSTLPQT